MDLDHSGSDGSSPRSGEYDSGSSSSGDHSSPSDSVYASPAGINPAWSYDLGMMVQPPWSTSLDSVFSPHHSQQVSPGLLDKPGQQTLHSPGEAALGLPDFWPPSQAQNGIESGLTLEGLMAMAEPAGEGMGQDFDQSMQVEFDDVVHHSQCG